MTSTICRRRHNVLLATLLTASCLAFTSAAHAQEIAVQNEAGATVKLTVADIAALPHQDVSVDDHGKTVKFTGVPLRLVLEKTGVTLGDSMRGKRMAECVLAGAADDYHAVFALPELDPGFTDRVILLADKVDGHPLDSKDGPYRIVVPGEKRMARWVRQVTTLKIVSVQ